MKPSKLGQITTKDILISPNSYYEKGKFTIVGLLIHNFLSSFTDEYVTFDSQNRKDYEWAVQKFRVINNISAKDINIWEDSTKVCKQVECWNKFAKEYNSAHKKKTNNRSKKQKKV